jgi:hypothetical protein
MSGMEEWEPIPPELLVAVFVATGLVVSIIYSIDWNRVFN